MKPSRNLHYTQTHRVTASENQPAGVLIDSSNFKIGALILAHPLLALAMHASSLIATAHALFTVAVGLFFALGKDPRKSIYVAAYITGAEVLWRMTEARIFWESGKYFTVLILGIALLRTKVKQSPGLPILYFVLLCLSIPLTLARLGISSAARDQISFNMSGPFAMALCAIYFMQITLDRDSLRELAWWSLLPILGIAALTFSGTVSARQLYFSDNSNFATSGGFGPNQVSAILGLGGGLAFLLFLTGKRTVSRWFTLFLTIILLALSALTFSRGGVYNAAAMMVLALTHYLRNDRGRLAATFALLVIGLAGVYVIIPRLNAFTGGMLEKRFSDLDTTLRGKIAMADLELWFANPLLGVGPGVAKTDRVSSSGRTFAAHTEYTRLLAEHGLAGLLALLILLWIIARSYLRAPNMEAKAWMSAMVAWSLVEMSHAAMRIVAISFLFGLALINWESDPQPEPLRNMRR